MTCDEATRLVTIDVFGSLEASDRGVLDEHLLSCPSCARAARRAIGIRDALAVPGGLRASRQEQIWEAIATRVEDRPTRWAAVSWQRWAFAASAVVAVFALGVVVGRLLPSDGLRSPAEVVGGQASGMTVLRPTTSFGRYAESLAPVLDAFAVSGARPLSAQETTERRRVLRSLIRETRLLGQASEQADDRELSQFLGELESLLLSMANLPPDDRESAEWLKQVIREREIASRVRHLAVRGSGI